jgi:hypothetical protein
MTIVTCINCGKRFDSKRAHAKCCSGKCRAAASRNARETHAETHEAHAETHETHETHAALSQADKVVAAQLIGEIRRPALIASHFSRRATARRMDELMDRVADDQRLAPLLLQFLRKELAGAGAPVQPPVRAGAQT